MRKTASFWTSSVGQKVLMALTGLFLCTFLVEHLIGNLLLLKTDGGATYDAYAEFLVSNIVIRVTEVGLFAALFGHALYGVILWVSNKRVRPQRYAINRPQENSDFPSRITFITGSIVFIFLVIHLRTFFVPSRILEHSGTLYQIVENAFHSPGYVGFYIVALFLLGYHLRHGFQSAFQTFGLRTSKYLTLINAIGFVFWFLIPVGFAIIPLYFLFFHTPGVH